MHATSIQIRLLGPADVDAFRAIRLEALKCNPEAFGSTFEVEKLRPLAWFSERLDNSDVFGAFRGSELVGVAGFAGSGACMSVPMREELAWGGGWRRSSILRDNGWS